MRSFSSGGIAVKRLWPTVLLAFFLAFTAGLRAMGTRPGMSIVPKWGRFEQAFKSSVEYSNALQDATLAVVFVSPLGETNQVYGFWDGGKVWRVRFSPNQPGRWTFKTKCSDAANEGLNNQTGRLLCTSATGLTRFEKHGLLQVARDQHHFEHADGTPFFWLADTVWNGARVSELKDWQRYAGTRGSQRFTVAQWSVAPGLDAQQDSAYTGFPDRIAVNPEFFQRLDAKVETLSRVGILSAIAPLAELESQNALGSLTDDQATLLVRYIVARWQAEPVAWLVALDGNTMAKKVGRWKRIGQAVFSNGPHAPVILYPGDANWFFDEFRDQKWVDAFGCQGVADVTDDGLKFAVAGPFAKEWTNGPARPIISFVPRENGMDAAAKRRFSAGDVRHAAYWSLLLAPPAGVSYSAQGVAGWDASVTLQTNKIPGANLPLWQKSLFLPGAKQMTQLANLVESVDFWRLRPQQQIVAVQPGDSSPAGFVAAAAAENKDLAMVYVPEERALDLSLGALPPLPAVIWFNPRTGEAKQAVGVVGSRSCQFPTPGPGDWVLLTHRGR
jgi:hypothetical protein